MFICIVRDKGGGGVHFVANVVGFAKEFAANLLLSSSRIRLYVF